MTPTFAVTCACGTQLHVPPQFAGRPAKCSACQRTVVIPFGPPSTPTVIEAAAISRSIYDERRPDTELCSYLTFVAIGLSLFAVFGRDWPKVSDARAPLVTARGEADAASTPQKLRLKPLPAFGASPRNDSGNKSDQPAVEEPPSESTDAEVEFGKRPWSSPNDEGQIAAVAAQSKTLGKDALQGAPDPGANTMVRRDSAVSPEDRPSDVEVPYDGPTAANITEALKLSRQLSKPTLLFIFADSCSWCRKMKSETLTDKNVQSAMRKYVCVTIDANDKASSALKSKYAVKGIPAYVITDRDGKLIKSGAGFQPEARDFAYWLDDSNVWKRVTAATQTGR